MKKTFRIIGLMLIAVMGFSLTACGGDDDGTPSDPNRINSAEAVIGSWKLTKWVNHTDNSERENVEGTFIIRKDGSFTLSGNVMEIFYPFKDSTYDEIKGTYIFYQNKDDSQLGGIHLDIDKEYKDSKFSMYEYENLKVKIYKDGVLNMTITQDNNWGLYSFKRTLYFKKN